MDSTEENASTSTTTWQEVAQESAANPEPRSELVTDTIKVPITDAALARIARENAADDLVRQGLEGELEDLKEKVKGKKGEIDVVTNRIAERHESVRSNQQTLRGQWRVVDIFATNTVQYLDPETGVVVFERPMAYHERQQELPLGDPSADDASDDDDDAETEEVDEELQAEAAPAAEDDDLLPVDDGTAITAPEGVLDGSVAEAAEKKTRVRRRRTKEA